MLTRFIALFFVFMFLYFTSTGVFAADCEKAGTLVNEANRLVTKKPAKSESLYKEAVKLCPDSASAHYNLGLAKFNRGDFSSAAVSFNEALRLNPQSVEVMNGLALSYASQGINYDMTLILSGGYKAGRGVMVC